MNDKEKQIRLLTKRISKIQDNGVKDIPNCTTIFIDNQELAEELLKYYQPNLPKDSVVLTKEEYEKYQNLKRDVEYSFEYNQGYTDGQNQARKETAREILTEIQTEIFHCLGVKNIKETDKLSSLGSLISYDLITDKLYELSKQYGVGIGE